MTTMKGAIQEPVPVHGIWLRTRGNYVIVAVEVEPGIWADVIRESADIRETTISHIVEPLGIRNAPTRSGGVLGVRQDNPIQEIKDLAAYKQGWDDALASLRSATAQDKKPGARLEEWSISEGHGHRSYRHLEGRAYDHPNTLRVAPGEAICTSPLVDINEAEGWAETRYTSYRLGVRAK